MNISTMAILSLSALTTILMIAVSFLMFLSGREKRLAHILEFWIANFIFFVLSAVTNEHGPKWIGASTVGTVWVMYSMIKITSDVGGRDLGKKWHKFAFGGGFSLGAVLALWDFPFCTYTMPGVCSIFLVGASVLIDCWRGLSREKITLLHYLYFLNILFIIVHLLDFPFLRLVENFAPLGYGMELLSTLLMAIILPGLTIHELNRERSKILEVVLDERNLQLERQSKMSALGEMTATLVHELNNPLGLLLTRNGLLMRKVEKDQFDKDSLLKGLTQMHLTIHRMMNITKSLRSFSRDQDFEVTREIKLQSLVDETLTFSSDRFLEANLPLLVGKVPDVTLQCKSVQISQVLLNLLNNAYDAVQTLPSKWVRIDFEARHESVLIMVVDSGRGIPRDLSEKIMQPFFTTKESGKGTGLGLSISQQIIKDHNGKLFIEPDSLNTTFVVELPCS